MPEKILPKRSSLILTQSFGDCRLLLIATVALRKADIMARLHGEGRCRLLGGQEAKWAVFLSTGLQQCWQGRCDYGLSGVGSEDSKTARQLYRERLTRRLWLQLIKAGPTGAEQVLETHFHQGTEGTTNRLLEIRVWKSIQKRKTRCVLTEGNSLGVLRTVALEKQNEVQDEGKE